MLDAELESFKAIPFDAVAANFGYSRLEGETGACHTLRNAAGDKVVAKVNPNGHWVYFSVHDRADNGTSLDFVQRRQGGGLGHARKALRAISGDNPSFPIVRPLTPVEPPTDAYQQTAAVWNAAQWNPAPAYLLSRGLSPATLADPIFRDCYRVDRNGNVLFPHHDTGGMCGYERRGPDCKRFGKDVNRGLWRSANLWSATTTEIVICEAPIDAMSHYQLYGGSLAYVATGGSLGQRQLDLLGLLFKRVIRSDRVWITVGSDNDYAGEKMYEQIQQIAPMKVHRLTPIGKDWNADLAWCNRENE